MKTIQQVLLLATEYFQSKGIVNPRREAEDLVAFLLKCKRLDLYLHFDQPLQENELVTLRTLTKRRAQGEPLEYIAGETEFFGIQLFLSPDVLIPRQETEILASKIAEKIEKGSFSILWDVCCGSGSLGLSLKKKFPCLDVTLSDISPKALEIARKNAERNGIHATFLQGDLFVPFTGQKADLILCNPPYVSECEYEQLDASVKHFEPKTALVGGKDGLSFYRRLAKEANSFLKPGGWLCLEIGESQGKAVIELFSSETWVKKILEKDWAGKDRFVFCQAFCLENE